MWRRCPVGSWLVGFNVTKPRALGEFIKKLSFFETLVWLREGRADPARSVVTSAEWRRCWTVNGSLTGMSLGKRKSSLRRDKGVRAGRGGPALPGRADPARSAVTSAEWRQGLGVKRDVLGKMKSGRSHKGTHSAFTWMKSLEAVRGFGVALRVTATDSLASAGVGV